MANSTNGYKQYQVGNRMLRSREVIVLTGLSRTTIWRLENTGEFPSRKKLSAGAVGWASSEVQEWIMHRERVVNSQVDFSRF